MLGALGPLNYYVGLPHGILLLRLGRDLRLSYARGLLRQDWPSDGGTVEMEGLAPSGRWMESRSPHYVIPIFKTGAQGPGFYLSISPISDCVGCWTRSTRRLALLQMLPSRRNSPSAFSLDN